MSILTLREATLLDSKLIAALHTQSWLNTYRGLLSDKYLDNDLLSEREKYWNEKLPTLTAKEFVLIAEKENQLVGFVSLLDKPEMGFEGFINNLHVHPDLKGQGIGGILMSAVAEKLKGSGRNSYYLWVIKGNTAAEEFYKAKGGKALDTSTSLFGGEPVDETRFGWK